jgi:hypothetical protein
MNGKTGGLVPCEIKRKFQHPDFFTQVGTDTNYIQYCFNNLDDFKTRLSRLYLRTVNGSIIMATGQDHVQKCKLSNNNNNNNNDNTSTWCWR